MKTINTDYGEINPLPKLRPYEPNQLDKAPERVNHWFSNHIRNASATADLQQVFTRYHKWDWPKKWISRAPLIDKPEGNAMPAPREPTPEMRESVKALACFGVRQAKIAAYVDLDEKTLRLHYRRELDQGLDMATAEVVRSLHKLATKPNGGMPTAVAINTWLVLMAGRSEKTAVAVNLDLEAGAYLPGESPCEKILRRFEQMSATRKSVEDPGHMPGFE